MSFVHLLLSAAWLCVAAACELKVSVGQECPDAGCAAPVMGQARCTGSACGRAEACGGRPQPLQRAPLDMYMMMDASGSHLFSWSETQRGLLLFLNEPASAGVGVGLQFFGDSCDPNSYATPAVPIGALPQHAVNLLAAFPLAPTRESPVRPALEGAILYARRWQEAHPTRLSVVTLVTDGFPEECESTAENVTEVAEDGLSDSPPIRTFVVGIDSLGGVFRFVGDVAAVGGVPALTVPAQAGDDLARAFSEMRDAARSCRYSAAAWRMLAAEGDVIRHVDAAGDSFSVPVVKDDDRCDPQHGGVYPESDLPDILVSCPASCARLDAPGTLELLSSCPDES